MPLGERVLLVIFWFSVGLTVNLFVGCLVLAAVDKNERLFNWANSAPNDFIYYMTVQLWPIIVLFWFMPRRGERRG